MKLLRSRLIGSIRSRAAFMRACHTSRLISIGSSAACSWAAQVNGHSTSARAATTICFMRATAPSLPSPPFGPTSSKFAFSINSTIPSKWCPVAFSDFRGVDYFALGPKREVRLLGPVFS
jgi:hypothetical protein